MPFSAGERQDALLYVPPGYDAARPAPFALLCHGAGSEARAGIAPLLPLAESSGMVLLGVDAHDYTWDLLIGEGDHDAQCLDALLEKAFGMLAIDPSRIALGGFSDGASYALSVGLANGDLFSHLIGFSPGFVRAPAREGTPRVFMSHGVHDRVLPIERCSRPIAARLREQGLDVRYEEFDDGHTVPPATARGAAEWLVGGNAGRPLVHEAPGEPDAPLLRVEG
jgi:phospholipase/carboxylesterase